MVRIPLRIREVSGLILDSVAGCFSTCCSAWLPQTLHTNRVLVLKPPPSVSLQILHSHSEYFVFSSPIKKHRNQGCGEEDEQKKHGKD